nr:MAG TPA: Sexual stage antigen s48/45 domain [Caudoviricetes sp.]
MHICLQVLGPDFFECPKRTPTKLYPSNCFFSFPAYLRPLLLRLIPLGLKPGTRPGFVHRLFLLFFVC